MTDMSKMQTTISSVPAASSIPSLLKAGAALLLVGIIVSAVGAMMDGERARTAFGYLWGFSFLWTLSLGALLLIALHHLTSAVWSVVFRRIMEMFASPLPLLALLFIPVLLIAHFGADLGLFTWLNSSNHIVEAKAPYLNEGFFTLRAAIYFIIWVGFGQFFVRRSLKQDSGPADPRITLTMRRFSAPFVILFGFTITYAGIDWLMSLAPLWFSTIFGVYIFAGMMLTALSAVTLATLALRKRGRMGRGVINEDHLYNLGTLMFAFTVFWAYIAFSQYMLIWYANMPEESFYIQQRLDGTWRGVSIALLIARFVLPFGLLLARGSKTNEKRLLTVSYIVLAGQLLDLYWLIMPQFHAEGPTLGWQELGPLSLFAGVLLVALAVFLKKHRAVAVGDPILEESICFHL